jgi:hypothetical protein
MARIPEFVLIFSPNSVSDRGFSIMLLQHTGCPLAGPGATLVPTSWCPHRSCSSNRIFVDQTEKRDLISRALAAQIPNPGSVSRRARREIFDVSPRVGAVGPLGVILQRCFVASCRFVSFLLFVSHMVVTRGPGCGMISCPRGPFRVIHFRPQAVFAARFPKVPHQVTL